MRVATGVVLWLAAAAAATTVGLFAVGAIGTDIFGTGAGEPLSQSEVDRQLAESPAPGTSTPPPTSSPTSSPAPASPPASTAPTTSATPPARTIAVRSAGGTVWARCVPGGVQVVATAPAQGFAVDGEDDEVDDHPHVRFRAGEREIEVRMRCADGRLTNTIEEKD